MIGRLIAERSFCFSIIGEELFYVLCFVEIFIHVLDSILDACRFVRRINRKMIDLDVIFVINIRHFFYNFN